MSVGTLILTGYGPAAALAAAAELPLGPLRRGRLGRLLGVGAVAGGWGAAGAAALAPLLSSYTAVLLSDTSTPTWHAGRRHLPCS